MHIEAAEFTLPQRMTFYVMHLHASDEGIGTGGKGMLLVGPPRSGRSAVLWAVGRSEPPAGISGSRPGAGIKPLMITAGPSSTTSRLIADIFSSLGDEVCPSAFKSHEAGRASLLLRMSGIQILLIDDADDLLDQKDFEGGREHEGGHLSLVDLLGILHVPYVLVGRETLRDRLVEKHPWFRRSITVISKIDDPLTATSAAAA